MKIDSINYSNTYQTEFESKKDAVDADSFKKKLEEAADSKDEKKLRDVCEQFEAVFVNMLFKEMRKTVQEGGLVEKSQARETFEGMLDEEMSKKVTEGGGIGLADMMVKSFMKRYDEPSDEGTATASLDIKG